jgi:hypothetical protein
MDDICSVLAGSKREAVCAGPDKDIETSLKGLGIDIRNADGELKTVYQILKELSDKFHNR